MVEPKRGEVWLADLGLAAKTRPVLIISVPFGDTDYALYAIIPHTTSPRQAQFEIQLAIPHLKPGAFNVQGMMAVPKSKFLRPIATLSQPQLDELEITIKAWLGLK